LIEREWQLIEKPSLTKQQWKIVELFTENQECLNFIPEIPVGPYHQLELLPKEVEYNEEYFQKLAEACEQDMVDRENFDIEVEKKVNDVKEKHSN
jgi:hypothetical protein